MSKVRGKQYNSLVDKVKIVKRKIYIGKKKKKEPSIKPGSYSPVVCAARRYFSVLESYIAWVFNQEGREQSEHNQRYVN